MTWTALGGAPGIYEAFADGYGRSFRDDPIAEGYAELRLLAATLMRLRAGRSDPRHGSRPSDVSPTGAAGRAPAWTAQ